LQDRARGLADYATNIGRRTGASSNASLGLNGR